jgi:hypothetical protein
MTIILTIISKDYSVTASDSKLTPIDQENGFGSDDNKKTISVPKFNGVLSYCGLAFCDGWNTIKWLEECTKHAVEFNEPHDFVQYMCKEINLIFKKHDYSRKIGMGIIIHFSCYEMIDNEWIPELYSLHNCDPLNARKFLPQGFSCHPNCFSCLPKEIFERYKRSKKINQQKIFSEMLHKGYIQILFNGSRPLCNSAIIGFSSMINQSRNSLSATDSIEFFTKMADWIVVTISGFQEKFFNEKDIFVGGPPQIISCSKIESC